MPRLQLRVYIDPGGAEIFINVRRKDGSFQPLTAAVDTGAAVTLLPASLLDSVDYRSSENDLITVDQAGISKQAFSAKEAVVDLFLEDDHGTRTKYFEAHVWFADTTLALLGFKDILDRAILHIDMRDTRSGWIEIDV